MLKMMNFTLKSWAFQVASIDFSVTLQLDPVAEEFAEEFAEGLGGSLRLSDATLVVAALRTNPEP